MRITGSLRTLVILTAGLGMFVSLRAQTPADAGATPASQGASAVPDANGVYRRGAGLVLPKLTDSASIAYPLDAPVAEGPRTCTLSLVVGADGTPSGVKVIRPLNDVVDGAAVDAISKRHFEAGTLDGKPVPVEIQINLHFFTVSGTAIPRVMAAGSLENAHRKQKWDKPPVPIHQVETEYTDKARKARLQGTVLLSFTVTEDGDPVNIQVKRGLGMGLDEKAVETLKQYKFRPAMKDGKPVAAELNIEMSYRLY